MSEIPQRQLLFYLKAAIDASNTRRVRALLRENPHGSWSKYVQHNLGVRRREWLCQQGHAATLLASPLQPTRSGLVNFSDETPEALPFFGDTE